MQLRLLPSFICTAAIVLSSVTFPLRAQNLPVYAVDLRSPDGSVTRRLFVGRFATRAEATETQQRIASAFPAARVIAAFEERLP